MLPPDTGRAMRAIRLLRFAEERGLDGGELLQRAGLSAKEIDEPDMRVPLTKLLWLWRALAEADPDPDLGIESGLTVRSREAGVLGYALAHSATLDAAVKRHSRFSRLVDSATEIEISEGTETWRLEVRRPPLQPGFRQPIDEGITAFVTVVREITGRRIDPVAIGFPYEKPASLSRLRSVLRCEMRFSQPRVSVELRASHMSIPLVDAEAQLSRYLDRLADQELASLPKSDTFARRVGRAVWPRLSEGQPTVGEIAAQLGVSPRTLQRRLREEGTSFARVVDGLRQQIAPVLLRDESLAVYEVAYLLGYSDPSAFFRAFRRWNQLSPVEFRRRKG